MTKLLAPDSYRAASPEERAKVCNGCGPSAWVIDPVPDRLLGLPISEACNIHDWMYHEGYDRARADAYLLANLVLLIADGSWWLRLPRYAEAIAYFLAVRAGGWAHFKRA